MKMLLLLIILFHCRSFGAERSQLDATFYPEKENYIVGEPIFVNLVVANNTDKSFIIDNTFGNCSERDSTEVVGASKRQRQPWAPSCYGGWGGSCGYAGLQLKPGEKVIKKFFLSGSFVFDKPGKYRIRSRRRIPLFSSNTDSRYTDVVEATSDFNINIDQGTEAQLKAAFEKYVKMLTNNMADNPATSWDPQKYDAEIDAVDAITTEAPAFLEELILRLSKDSRWLLKTIPALGRLNTERTRKRLAEMAEDPDKSKGWLSQPAVGALAYTRNPSVLDVLMRIGSMDNHPARSFAIWDTGLYGDAAIPYLTRTLKSSDPNKRTDAVRALGATGSRQAVPILIQMLPESKGYLLRDVRISLAQLTHFAVNGNPKDETPTPDEYSRWLSWWALNGETAQIFDTEQCSPPQKLP